MNDKIVDFKTPDLPKTQLLIEVDAETLFMLSQWSKSIMMQEKLDQEPSFGFTAGWCLEKLLSKPQDYLYEYINDDD